MFLYDGLAGIPVFNPVEGLACFGPKKHVSQPFLISVRRKRHGDLHPDTTPLCMYAERTSIPSPLLTGPDTSGTPAADPVTAGAPPSVRDEHIAALVMVMVLMVVMVELVKMTLRSVT